MSSVSRADRPESCGRRRVGPNSPPRLRRHLPVKLPAWSVVGVVNAARQPAAAMLPGPALPCMPSRDEGTSEGSETVTMEAISRTLQMQLRQDREVLTGEINKAMTQVNARVDDIEVALDGWDPDPSGEETLQKAKGVIRSTSIRRRGSCQDSGGGMRYAILPFQTRTGETHEEARHWVQRAVQRVRTWDAEETAPRAGCGWPSAKAQQRGRGHSSRAKTRGGWSWSWGRSWRSSTPRRQRGTPGRICQVQRHCTGRRTGVD